MKSLVEFLEQSEFPEECARYSLKWHYDALLEDIENLESLDFLEGYQKEDLMHHYGYLAGFRTVLEYYGVKV